MKKRLLIYCFIAFALQLNAQEKKHPVIKSIDSYIQAEMKETATPGMAVAVIKDGKILHYNTYGTANIEYDIPVSGHTNFAIASVTKLITSTLIMKWVQQGKIGMEDNITKYLPDAHGWKDIKIKHLLAHEGGIQWPSTLGGYLGIGSAANFKVEPMEVVISKLKDSALVFQPGTRQAYQNGDYFVLQYIIEKIGGAPMETVLKNEVLTPFGMKDGGYDVEYRAFPFQTMYPVRNKSQNFTRGLNGPLIFKGFYAPSSYNAGGLFLSLSDLTAWASSLDKELILKKSIQQEAVSATGVKDGFSQMGWVINNNNGVFITGHSGGPGLADVLRVPADKFTVIVLTNNSDLYAYMAGNILKMFYPQIALEQTPKQLKRNLVR